MAAYELDPVSDPRWAEFLHRHPSASVFHLPGWLKALRETYGYQPIAWTTSQPGQPLRNGIAFCRIKSWLTGSRLVSLPFSDHCEPLIDDQGELQELLACLRRTLKLGRGRYFELRPFAELSPALRREGNLGQDAAYLCHTVDLRPDLDTLFRQFHKSCVQRKIRRAERENLDYEEGRSDVQLRKFYDLLVLTRRRHGLPPQPLIWFQNLIGILQDKVLIRVVSKDGQPIASILTLGYKQSLVYKYGCSDARHHNLGGMALLFWKAIQDGKAHGAELFDLGRSERDNEGLVAFKENWASKSMPLTYYRYPGLDAKYSASGWSSRVLKGAFSRCPNSLLAATGRLLYRHIG